MSEETKLEEVSEVEEPKEETVEEPKEESKEETVEEPKEEAVPDKKPKNSPFVNDEDRFDVSVEYFKVDNKLYVDAIDDDYEAMKKDAATEDDVATLTVSLKYPNTGDFDMINFNPGRNPASDGLQFRDYIRLQLSRLIVLIRGWNSDKEVTADEVMGLHPKITNGLLIRIHEAIGTDGLS